MLRHPVDASDHTRGRTGAVAAEPADGNKPHSFRHAVRASAKGAAHVGAVTITIGAVTAEGIETKAGASTELRVGVGEARVDDVRGHASTRGVVRVAEAQRPSALVDAIQPPGLAPRIHRLRYIR